MACVGVQGAVSWMIIGWMPTQMREQFNLGQGAAGFSALGFLYAAQTIGLLAGGYWTDRRSLTNPRARIFIPAIAALALVAMLERLNYYVISDQVRIDREQMIDTLADVTHAALFGA